MEDNKQTTQPVNTADTGKNEDNKAGEKTFTQADMDNLAGKIRGEEKAKIDQIVKEAIAERDRQAKLTEDEREKEVKTQREKELKERENNITLRERRLTAQELLSQKNIPIDLVDFVVDLDEAKTKDNIEKLAKTYNKSVENGVTDKLKGNPPVDFSKNNNDDTDTSKKIMSAF